MDGLDDRDTGRVSTANWDDLDGNTDGLNGDAAKAKRRGTRGRGRRINYTKKPVFQPTVRALPLGQQERVGGEPGRGLAAKRIGRGGLLLVNRKPGSASSSPSTSDAHERSLERTSCARPNDAVENPWARRSQSHAKQQPEPAENAQQSPPPATRPLSPTLVSDEAGHSDEPAEQEEAGVCQSLDAQRVTPVDGAEPAAMRSDAISSGTESSSDVGITESESQSTDAPPAVVLPAKNTSNGREPKAAVAANARAGAGAADAWGSRAKTAAANPMPAADPPKSRWWKASLSGGVQRADTSHLQSARNPSLPAQKPSEAVKSDGGSDKGKSSINGRGRRAQAPIPTVVPPLVLARAAVRSAERRPVAADGKAARLRDSAVMVATAVSAPPAIESGTKAAVPSASAERSNEAAPTASEAPAATELSSKSAAGELGTAAAATAAAAAKKRVSIHDPTQTSSWRSTTVSLTEPAVEPAKSTARGAARTSQTGERRERARTTTHSMAAMSANWRLNPNRPKSTAVDDTALATAAVAVSTPPDPTWISQPADQQQQQQPLYYDSGLSDLLHFSTAVSRSSAAISAPFAPSSSPPLLPPTMLAELLGDGEPARRSAATSQVPTSTSSSSAAPSVSLADDHARARRISSVVGVSAQGESKLGYASRARSSSSLFHAGHHGSVSGDQGLFLWDQGPAPDRIQNGMSVSHQQPQQQLWSYQSQPPRADNMSGLAFGVSPAPTFSAFSTGAAMLWAEPTDYGVHAPSGSRPSSRAGGSSQYKAPRPIGTRSTPATNGARSAQKPPWQLHYSPAQPQYMFGSTPESVAAEYGTYPALSDPNAAPYMVFAQSTTEHFGPVLADGFGASQGAFLGAPAAQYHAVRPASPPTYSYAYPGFQHQQQHHQQSNMPYYAHHPQMALVPMYMNSADGHAGHPMPHAHPVAMPAEGWPTFFQQPTTMPPGSLADGINHLSVAEKHSPSVTRDNTAKPIDSATAKPSPAPSTSNAPRGGNGRQREHRPRGGVNRNGERKPQPNPNSEASPADSSSGSRRTPRGERNRRPKDAEDKQQASRRNRGANRKPGARKRSNTDAAC
ncbi:hypothetical protein IWW52_000731 [Coemansia sp. RSA 2704]|nr:hypothetical protein IWW54_000832 [Coemansia sp. RSA 2705]KAJ2321459.1 hypothetical protein IWW52_000731 [Coemansia sp. RSA 2704]